MKNYPLFSSTALGAAYLLIVPLQAQATTQIHSHSHGAVEKPRTAQHKPTRGDILWQQAEDAWHKGDHEAAIKSFLQLIKVEPDNIDAYSNAAWLMWSAGRADAAAALMRQGVGRNPLSWDFWYGAGEHFVLQKREPKAAHVFYERALALKPRGQKRWLNLHRLAFAAERAGNAARAIQVWQRTLLETPNDAVAQRKLRELKAKAVGTTSTR